MAVPTESDDSPGLFEAAASRGAAFRATVAGRPVFPLDFDIDAMRAALGTLPETSTPPSRVLEQLATAVEPGLVANAGPRYFGFVVGGSLDAAAAADVLTTGWDQVAYSAVSSPAAALVEDVAGAWLKDLLDLPQSATFGFVTGGQAANTVCLAAARQKVLGDAGWDVSESGLAGAPRVRVATSVERHATIDRSIRLLGLGMTSLELVETDANGAIDVDDFRRVLNGGPTGPTIVSLQAGNVNTGAFDDFEATVDLAHEAGAWVHVDGAFGLWAAACPSLRTLTKGASGADSWATDGHKWLNVPYDCGYAFTAHPEAHKAAMAYSAAYLGGPTSLRSPGDFVTESSRRARGFATWAALSQLGRSGVAELIDRCSSLARRFATALQGIDGLEVVNDVVLNQVLLRARDDDTTDRLIASVQQSGECWMGATTWHGMRLMRISVSNWQTDVADVDRSVAAIAAAVASL